LVLSENAAKKGLSDLSSYVNVNGHEAAGRRVVAERTRLERFADVGEEWHMDVLMLRQFHRFPLDREGAHVFTRVLLVNYDQ